MWIDTSGFLHKEMWMFLLGVLIVICSASHCSADNGGSVHISGGPILGQPHTGLKSISPRKLPVADAQPKKSKSVNVIHEATTIAATIGSVSREKEAESEEDEEHSSRDEVQWECGTDEFSKFIAESTIDRDCPHLKESVNNCCLAHDKCYDDQLGRTYCDDTFCACLDKATVSSQKCAEEDAPTFCGLVREFGEDPYVQAGLLKSAPNGTAVASATNNTYTSN